MKIKTGSRESLTPTGGDRESPTLAWIRVLVCLANIPSPRARGGKNRYLPTVQTIFYYTL
jgi:hypothetical protein